MEISFGFLECLLKYISDRDGIEKYYSHRKLPLSNIQRVDSHRRLSLTLISFGLTLIGNVLIMRTHCRRLRGLASGAHLDLCGRFLLLQYLHQTCFVSDPGVT